MNIEPENIYKKCSSCKNWRNIETEYYNIKLYYCSKCCVQKTLKTQRKKKDYYNSYKKDYYNNKMSDNQKARIRKKALERYYANRDEINRKRREKYKQRKNATSSNN